VDPDREPVDEGETEGHAVARLSRAGAAIRRVAIDVSPLRESRAFRLLTFGQLISLTGRQVSTVALPIQIYVLTQSSLALGLVGLVQIVPLAVFSIWGGTWADRFDRRLLILVSECGLAVTSVLFLAGALAGHPPVWYLYAVVAVQTAFFAVNFPARSAVVPSVVGRARLPAALALNQVMYNTTLVVGPAAAGFIIGAASSTTTGLAIAYGLDVATFLASIGTTIALPPLPPERKEGERAATGWQSVKEGFRFLRGKRVLIATFAIDLNAMIFGMPRALFPVLAAEVFHRGPAAVGLLYAAPAFGALAGALTTGWVGRVRHQGMAVIWSVVAWGATITLFGFSGNVFWLGLLFLAVAGAADMVSAVFRGTILQLGVPDALRGRLSAVHILVVTGGPRLGDFESGGVAALAAPFFATAGAAAVFSVITGGLACLAGVGVVSLLYPELRRYHADDALSGSASA
jgi:Transmembrane secretion effector